MGRGKRCLLELDPTILWWPTSRQQREEMTKSSYPPPTYTISFGVSQLSTQQLILLSDTNGIEQPPTTDGVVFPLILIAMCLPTSVQHTADKMLYTFVHRPIDMMTLVSHQIPISGSAVIKTRLYELVMI